MVQAEIRKGDAWLLITAQEAFLIQHSAMRCAACRQRVIVHGGFRPGARPHFNHYRPRQPCAPYGTLERPRDTA